MRVLYYKTTFLNMAHILGGVVGILEFSLNKKSKYGMMCWMEEGEAI